MMNVFLCVGKKIGISCGTRNFMLTIRNKSEVFIICTLRRSGIILGVKNELSFTQTKKHSFVIRFRKGHLEKELSQQVKLNFIFYIIH